MFGGRFGGRFRLVFLSWLVRSVGTGVVLGIMGLMMGEHEVRNRTSSRELLQPDEPQLLQPDEPLIELDLT